MNMQQLITTFQPISLDEMKGIRLMNRIDTKFITTTPMLLQLLNMASQEYFVQEINGNRNMLYRTVYYDTERMDMYNAHQHGHANRQKMRYRTYVDSNLQFLEVKTKNNHGRTKKKRIQAVDRTLNDEKLAFLQETLHYDAFSLRPTLENEFHRITLVNHNRTERVTLDTDLRHHRTETRRTLHVAYSRHAPTTAHPPSWIQQVLYGSRTDRPHPAGEPLQTKAS